MRPHIRDIMKGMERMGCTDLRFQTGKKHPRIYFRHGGREMFKTVPGTPSDNYHTVRNSLSELRHMLGIVGAKEPSP